MARPERLDGAPAGGVVVRDEAEQPSTGGWRTGLKPAARPRALRELPALLALLPGLRVASTERHSRASTSTTARAASCAPRSARRERDRDGARTRPAERAGASRVLTGGEAVAEAMRQIDPDVVPVYPITPADADHPGLRQVRRRRRARTEIVNVESEHSAMSAAIGAALAGARTMTATSSQGLALMAEVVYIAASMRAPIVMALGNRALSGPINIHCDHSDSMLIRDSGVIQLFAENAQEAYDLTVIAPRLAEHPDVLAPRARLPGRLHDHPLGRAGRAARRRRDVARVRRRLPDPAPAARPRRGRPRRAPSRCPTTTSSSGTSRSAAIAGGAGESSRSSATSSNGSPAAAYGSSRPTGSTTRSARSSAWAPRPARRRTSSTSSAPRARRSACSRSARSGRSRPRQSARRSRASRPSSCSTGQTRPAARRLFRRGRRGALPARPRVRSHVYGLGGRDLHPDGHPRASSPAPRPTTSGVRSEPCPV